MHYIPIVLCHIQGVEWLNIFANIIMAFASIANLVIIICFYRKDKHDRVDARKKQSDLYWFRTIILEKNIDSIELFFDINYNIAKDCKELLKNKDMPTSEKKFKSFFGKHAEEKDKLNISFVGIIKIINKALGQTMLQRLNNFQDEFTEHLEKWIDKDLVDGFNKCNKIISNHKDKFIKDLYNYEHNLL